MKNLKFITLFILIVYVTGCVGTGNEKLAETSKQEIDVIIQEGVTTKAEIQKLFGSPMEIGLTENGDSKWSYSHHKSNITPASLLAVIVTYGISGTKSEGEDTQLVILFNDKDIVQRYDIQKSDFNYGTNLFSN